MSFHYRGLDAKLGSQVIPGVTGRFGLGVQNEAGKRLTEYCQESILIIANTLSNTTRDNPTHRQNQMVNTEIELIVFFAPEDGEVLYNQEKEDLE